MSAYTNYDKISEFYDKGRRAAGADVITGMFIVNSDKNIQDIHLLDLGCGTGNYAAALANLGIGKISLADGSEGMLLKARQKLHSEGFSDKMFSSDVVVLPEVPFQDNMFDAVMINQVLHHLEKSPNGMEFPTIMKTFEEIYRILKPGGILLVTNTLREQLKGLWFYQLMPQVLKRFQLRTPSINETKEMMVNAGFRLQSALSFLGFDWFSDYANLDGPLSESWRQQDSFFSSASDEEITRCIQFVQEMKADNTLKSFFLKHDGSNSSGAFAIFVGKKEN